MNSREPCITGRRAASAKGVDAQSAAPREQVLTDIECVRAAFNRVQGGRNILRPSDFKRLELESERTGRRLQLAQLQHGERIADVAHDRQAAQVGNGLAQQVEPLAGKIGRQC